MFGPACGCAVSAALSYCTWTNCGYVKHMCGGGSGEQKGQGLFICNLRGFHSEVNLQRCCTWGPLPLRLDEVFD